MALRMLLKNSKDSVKIEVKAITPTPR